MMANRRLLSLSQKKAGQSVDPFGFVCLADVKAEPIHWLWRPYIPKGALTMIMGDGGFGKSWLTCALAADLSQGRPLPGQEALPPQRILMIGAEDGLSQVLEPKLELLKANMDNIFASDKGFEFDGEAFNHLVSHIREYDAAVVFLDPLVVYMGGHLDMFRANEARAFLTLLSSVAKDTCTAVVAVHHVRKMGANLQQHRVMGSADFVNGVRSALMVDQSKSGQRYMTHIKSNWAKNGPNLAYEFNEQGFKWSGEYEGPPGDGHEICTTRRGEIKAWLIELLKDGPVPAQEGIRKASAMGFPERTINRARKGVVMARNNGKFWEWVLEPGILAELKPQDQAPEPESQPISPEPEPDPVLAEALRRLGRGPIHV